MTLTEVAMRRCSSTNTVCFVPAYLLYRPTAHACPATAQKGTRMSSTAAWGRAHGALFAFPSCCAFRFVCTPSKVDSGGSLRQEVGVRGQAAKSMRRSSPRDLDGIYRRKLARRPGSHLQVEAGPGNARPAHWRLAGRSRRGEVVEGCAGGPAGRSKGLICLRVT